MILAFVNWKGGVGKSTCAVNVGAALASRGKRVLIVDADSQQSAGLALGIGRNSIAPNLGDVLLHGIPAGAAIVTAGPVDLLPAGESLASADVFLSDVKDRETVLHRALATIAGRYDFILIDSPPSLGLLVVNVLTACDGFIVPTSPHYLSLEGVSGLMEAIEKLRASFHVGELVGIVVTLVDYRKAVTGEVIGILREHFGAGVFRTEIRQSVKLEEAPSYGKSILDYAPNSPAAESYGELAAEILRCVKRY